MEKEAMYSPWKFRPFIQIASKSNVTLGLMIDRHPRYRNYIIGLVWVEFGISWEREIVAIDIFKDHEKPNFRKFRDCDEVSPQSTVELERLKSLIDTKKPGYGVDAEEFPGEFPEDSEPMVAVIHYPEGFSAQAATLACNASVNGHEWLGRMLDDLGKGWRLEMVDADMLVSLATSEDHWRGGVIVKPNI